jgi:hypothetical protein
MFSLFLTSCWLPFTVASMDEIKAAGEFYIFRPTSNEVGAFVLKDKETMINQRVAVVVHGMDGTAAKMVDLGRLLWQMTGDGPMQNKKIYDAVWAYQYNWQAHIDASGNAFAANLKPLLNDAKEVHIFAHSLGGLVSRWGIEKAGLGAQVKVLVMLGSPNDGVPLEKTASIVHDVFPASRYPCILDLLTSSKGESLNKQNDFLRRLNTGDSPYRTTARYFTLAGNKPTQFRGLEGGFMQLMYELLNHDPSMKTDGLVPEYSVFAPELAAKSESWATQLSQRNVVPLGHGELGGSRDNLDGQCTNNNAKQCILIRALRPWILSFSQQ